MTFARRNSGLGEQECWRLPASLDILEMSDYSQAGLWLDDASSLALRTSISGSGTFDLKLGAMQYGVAGNVRFDTLEISSGYDLNRLG